MAINLTKTALNRATHLDTRTNAALYAKRSLSLNLFFGIGSDASFDNVSTDSRKFDRLTAVSSSGRFCRLSKIGKFVNLICCHADYTCERHYLQFLPRSLLCRLYPTH